MSDTRHFILGAAGHVDHGKTALITALTGTHTDRLKEEQERGISIELGFAELDLGQGVLLGVVDMPGHEKFVKQMVSGAGGVDLAFLLVAADEGVMPQTIEHLEILDSLGVSSGVVVMSKADLVDDEILAVATEEAMELVAGTFLEDKPIVAVSAHAGTGLDELKNALREAALALPVRREEGAFRLPVDRVFTLPGAGVVITGTCWGGAVKVGDKLVMEPGDTPVRVREVQVHGSTAERGASGQRLALALHGVKKDEIGRGFQLVTPGGVAVTRRLDLRVNVMAHYQGVIKNRQRVHVHHAGREVLARIVLLDEQELGGQGGPRTGLAQLHLEDELVAAREDRLVLRFYSPVTSIAGGVVLDAVPQRHKRFDESTQANLMVMESGDPAELFRQKLLQAGTEGLLLADALGQQDDSDALRAGKRLYHRDLMQDLTVQISDKVTEYAARFPLRLGVPKEECRRKCKFKAGPNEWHAICQKLAETADWVVTGDRIGPSAEGPPLTPALSAAIASAAGELASFGLDWPGLDKWVENSAVFKAAARDAALAEFKAAEVVRHLGDHGQVVAISSEFVVPQAAMDQLLQKLRGHFAAEPELVFSEFRELSGLTRKLGIPMLEYLDQFGWTVRRGDVREAGTKLEEEL
ncbi:MAG: selenocysteine-specific translation elongation factor [Candidatus Krumholzibacteria bacterium]|nr:selenocysteine-specific translation elongation factor [Candidatus Krumholzibacteria bacterium]